jgi:hypothetical protein
MDKIDRVQALDAIPTSWLDNLLSGPSKVIADGGTYTGADIQNLLLAVRERIAALPAVE